MNVGRMFTRFWAYTFDCIIVIGIYAGLISILRIMGMSIPLNGLLEKSSDAIFMFYSTYGLLFLIYETVFLGSGLSATPGKLILGLEVCCYSKGSLVKVFLRALIKVMATILNPIPLVFFFFALFSKNHQSPHDLLAQTLVVNKNNDTASSQESSFNIFDEMAKRGLNTYDEQLELMNQLKGTREVRYKSASYAWLGGVFLVFSIVCGIWFITSSYSDVVNYAQTASIGNPRFKVNGMQVDEEIADKYVGLWSTSDKKFGFRVYYLNGTMFINTSKRGLKFRFDSSNTLFVTDGNENEYKTSISNDSIIMSRPVNRDLEMRFSLYRVNE